MKKKMSFSCFEIEKKTMREEEFGKMTPENKSEDGVVKHSKEQEQ